MNRGQSILANGPDPTFREPGALPNQTAEAFSSSIPGLPRSAYATGDARAAAVGKANSFPNEGGPVVVQVEVPLGIAQQAQRPALGEVRFAPGEGLEALLAVWANLAKRLCP
jgi:hypothetical protein